MKCTFNLRQADFDVLAHMALEESTSRSMIVRQLIQDSPYGKEYQAEKINDEMFDDLTELLIVRRGLSPQEAADRTAKIKASAEASWETLELVKKEGSEPSIVEQRWLPCEEDTRLTASQAAVKRQVNDRVYDNEHLPRRSEKPEDFQEG